MKTKHTPGPWAVASKANSSSSRHPAIVADSGQVAIATFQNSEHETDANARLIAAAPDLLEALQNMIDWKNSGLSPERARDIARAAITKATGDRTND